MNRLHKLALIFALVLGMAGAGLAQVIGSFPAVTGYKQVVETDLNPTMAVKPGSTVAIEGANLGIEPGSVEVSCISAEIISWTPTRIVIRVPQLAPTAQPVQVTVFTSSPPMWYRALGFRILQ